MESTPTDEGQALASCPAVKLRRMEDVLAAVRSKSIVNPPEMFAAVAADPVNGEINRREFLQGSIMFTDGEVHFERRKMLNRLVRPDALTAIREEVILPEAKRLMAQRLAEPGQDGHYRMDVVEFCERVFLNFTARLIGLVGADTDGGMTALRQCAPMLAAGTSSQFLENRSAINEMAVAAKRRYVEEFFKPSRAAMEEMLAEVERGERSENDVPNNLMRLICTTADPVYADEHQAIVETTIMLAASVGTSTQSVVHTIEFLLAWFDKHPEDRERRTDVGFLLDAMQETIRLRAPFSSYTTRMAAEDCRIGEHHLTRGQELHVEFVSANRDPEVFGDDANEFNPHRPSPATGLARYGVGFGNGPHQCYGLRVVLGNEGAGGAHVHMLGALMAAGVDRDPAEEPTALKKDLSKFAADIPRYLKFPAIFRNWDPKAQ